MNLAIAVIRPFHATLMANSLQNRGNIVQILTSAPRTYFKGLNPAVGIRVIPAPVQILKRTLPFQLPESAERHGLALWDRMVAAALPPADAVIGFATQALTTGRRARSRGTRFLLDRACPHVDFQQNIVRSEAEHIGARYRPQPPWFRERQLEEYALADSILVPSHYTAASFPPELRHKLVLAPLLGRELSQHTVPPARDAVFTVGVLGGNPLRKGYLYLLQAWKQMAIPNARLLIRNQSDFANYPLLQELLQQLPNVEFAGYVDNISSFYSRCDVFCLPSVDDGFGMALSEAMAYGLPCVATDHCGASELMTAGVDGLVVPARDPDALAQALLSLYRDPALRESIGHAGRQTIARIEQQALYENALIHAVTGNEATLRPE